MMSNTGLAPLKERYPTRVLDVGIAEANAYCSAAGMAIGGLKPFVTVYSTFSQRAFDQLVHDIALQNLPVRIMMDRGGFVGNDGPTHHGVFDHSYLRLIPGLVHMAPRDERDMRRMLLTALAYQDGPIAMRYPRGDTPVQDLVGALEPIPIGRGELVRAASQPGLLIAAVGSMVATALETADLLEAEGVPVSVVDARFIKPLDEKLLGEQISRAKVVLTMEENVLAGGFGESVLALMAQQGMSKPVRLLGAPDRFVSFGSQADQLRESGLSRSQVVETARELWRSVNGTSTRLRRVKG
jgi:1-deoxy-D-xylulose-5-phosphate synthase